MFTDDAAVSQLLNKLDQCTDGDKYSRVLRQLQDLFENADQRVRAKILYMKEREREREGIHVMMVVILHDMGGMDIGGGVVQFNNTTVNFLLINST